MNKRMNIIIVMLLAVPFICGCNSCGANSSKGPIQSKPTEVSLPASYNDNYVANKNDMVNSAEFAIEIAMLVNKYRLQLDMDEYTYCVQFISDIRLWRIDFYKVGMVGGDIAVDIRASDGNISISFGE